MKKESFGKYLVKKSLTTKTRLHRSFSPKARIQTAPVDQDGSGIVIVIPIGDLAQ